MPESDDFHTIALILRHCMSLQASEDQSSTRNIAEKSGLLRDGSPTKEGRLLATLIASNEAISYLKVKKISERLEIEKQNESVKRNSSLDSGMFGKPKLHHSDSCSELSSDFQYSEKVKDFLCEPSNNGKWDITRPYKR